MTHLITCQGSDHLVNIQFGRHNFVIVNVHFEPEHTLRQLRPNCVLFTRTGLHIPMVWALFWVTLTLVIPKKDDLMSGTRHSPMATRERLLCSTLSFHTSLRFLNLITRGGTPQPFGSHALFQTTFGIIRTLSRIDRFLSIYLWLKHDIFTVALMSLRTW